MKDFVVGRMEKTDWGVLFREVVRGEQPSPERVAHSRFEVLLPDV